MLIGAEQTILRDHPRVIISTEEAPEDPATLHARMRKIAPDYKFRGSHCLFTGDEIRTEAVFFE
jgi:hypothetical protein